MQGDNWALHSSALGISQTDGTYDLSTVNVLDLQTGSVVDSLKGHTGSITSVVFSPCGGMIATSSYDSTIRIWNSSLLGCRSILEGHSREVRTVCWSGTGREVISGFEDTTIKVWSITTNKCTNTFTIHTNVVYSIASLPDSSLVASGSLDGTIKVFNAETGDVVRTISAYHVSFIRFLNRDQIMYARDSMFVIRDLRTSVNVSTTFNYHGNLGEISSDGTRLVSADGRVMKIWQTNLRRENHDMVGHHTDQVLDISFSKDGQLVATGSGDGTAKIWDTSTGQCLTTLRGHRRSVYQVLISPDSSICASSGLTQIATWDVHSGSRISTLEHREWHELQDMCFSPNGSQLASLETYFPRISGCLKLWEITTGNCLASIEGCDIGKISFDVDGSSITVKGNDSCHTMRISSAPAPIHSTIYDPANNLSSLPMILVPIDSSMSPDISPVPHQPRDLNPPWILDKGENPLLWILPTWRLSDKSFHGNKFVFTSSEGRVIIGEFLNTRSISSL